MPPSVVTASQNRIWIVLVTCVVVAGGLLIGWKYWPTPTNKQASNLVIVISGDTAGWIVPCGCTANQSGGLLRRGTFISQQEQWYTVILADAGGAASGTSEYHKVKLEAILRGELAMGLVAHNLGQSEAALGLEYLKTVGQRLKVPFVTANITDASGQRVFPVVRIVERAGKRIAITGLLGKQFSSLGLQVQEPKEALLNVVAEHRQHYDSLIVLAYLSEEEMVQLASDVPEADAIIGGPTGQAIKPRQVGQTLVGSATNKGKFLVRLETPVQTRMNWTGRVIELSQSFTDDASQQQNVNSYLDELTARDIAAVDSGFIPILNRQNQNKFAGNQACLQCHQSDCQQWEQSKHAHAWKTLQQKGYQVDPYCQQCHTTGFGLESGFVSARLSLERTSVGCESCHGPSLTHVNNVKLRTTLPARDQCMKCHDPENSPLFQYDTYWPRITHGRKP